MAITLERVKVTPDMATDWLGTMSLNRNLNKHHVQVLAAAISTGEWEDNGETVKFNTDGTLIDGQHRLTAIRDLNTSMELWVARGLSHAAQATLDTGKKRSVYDVFHMREIPNAAATAAAIGVLWRYQNDMELRADAPSAPTALELYTTNPNIQRSHYYGVRAWNSFQAIRPGLAIGLHYIFATIDAEKADEFFESLTDGIGLSAGSPILALRKLLSRLLSDQKRATKRVNTVYVNAVVVKAWNAWRDGRITQFNGLRWRRSGLAAEAFPKPH